MLTFEPLSVAALRKARPYFEMNPSLCSDLSAGYLFLWGEDTHAQVCFRNGTFLVRQDIGEQPAFSYPVGADPDGMIDELIGYVHENALPLRFFAVDGETLERIRGDKRLQPAMWAYDRRWSDYIYSFAEALAFRGKKYNGQRNHINRFKKLYGEPDLRFLTEKDRPAVEALLAAYAAEHPDGNALERLELERTIKLFDACGALGMPAAGVFVGGTLAAVSIGEPVGEKLLIHTEKALTRYPGVYPVMYSGFLRLTADRAGRIPAFVNREDDSGDPGLRTSKLQYHPLTIVHKRLVHVGSPAAKMAYPVTVFQNGVVLTELRESDKRAYLALNTDVENNRWWGYDYREDISLTGPVDENTFFDAVSYDMAAGDSVNFAVRLRETGDMIGEAVLWNFSSDGSAELGCRILPAFQKHGYGKAAFGAAAAFGAGRLGVRVWARCFRENAASVGMITANGFVKRREDDTFFYFEQKT